MSTPPKYLKQRRRGWYVQLPVPRQHQAALGCKVLIRSLQTRDETEAQKLRHRVIAELQAYIAKTALAPSPATPEGLLKIAEESRAAVEANQIALQEAEDGFAASVDDYLEKEAKRLGTDEEGHPKIAEAAVMTLNRAHRVLSGNASLTIGRQVERYMVQVRASSLMRQTVSDKQRHLDAFLDWIGSDTECRRVTKARASAYVDEVITPRELSQQSKRTIVNTLRQFFDWLEARDLVSLNPFDKAGKLLKDSTRGKQQARRSWTPEELFAVLEHVPKGDPLWAYTALGAYTGARREDIAALRVEAVQGDVLVIIEGKTKAAPRRVPIHPVIGPLVSSLVESSTDGYLLPHLLTGGDDVKRGHYIGKRFVYMMRKQLKMEDSRLVFHAFRNTILTQMEAAGVDLSLREQIAGHNPKSITERVYTAKASDERRAAALAHVTYGPVVDELVTTVGQAMRVTRRSRRRKLEP